MRTIGPTTTAVLALFLGIAAPAYARQGQQDDKHDHPGQNQQKGDHAQGRPEQQHGQSQKHDQQQHAQPQQQQTQHQRTQHQQQAHAQQQTRPFQYNGYWFSLVDPWPENWANNWYDTDDVYVNYVNNGYYLYDRRQPSIGVAINISL